jgi:hypothetical protein
VETVEVPTVTKVPKDVEVTAIGTIDGDVETPVIGELEVLRIQTVEWIAGVACAPSAVAKAARPRRKGTSPSR